MSSLQTDANLSQPPLFEDCAVCCIGSVNLTDDEYALKEGLEQRIIKYFAEKGITMEDGLGFGVN